MRRVARMAKPRWCGVALMRRALLAITRLSVTRADAASRRAVAGTGAGAGVHGALCTPQERCGARGRCSHAPAASVSEETTHACVTATAAGASRGDGVDGRCTTTMRWLRTIRRSAASPSVGRSVSRSHHDCLPWHWDDAQTVFCKLSGAVDRIGFRVTGERRRHATDGTATAGRPRTSLSLVE